MIEIRKGVLPVMIIGLLVCIGVGWGVTHVWRTNAEHSIDSVVLLVHGMTLDNEDGTHCWGRLQHNAEGQNEWTGMIGRLQQEGLRFGGIIRARGPELRLPESLNTLGVAGEPQSARLFCLEFSSAANTDGLAYKAIELAACLKAIREYSGCGKVRIVAHSAGGMAARTYLQGALPGIPYRGDIDRLITIATPHLGAAMATHLGDLLATRATSLRPDAELIHNLNQFDLPTDVRFASIVVRGIAADVHGSGNAYLDQADQETLTGLPVDFQQGGDDIVHVISQNMRLARCARRYEKASGRPILAPVCRVPRPPVNRILSIASTVHSAAPSDPGVQDWVVRLLTADDRWTIPAPEILAKWQQEQARQCAFSAVEESVLETHPLYEVLHIDVDTLESQGMDGTVCRYHFRGTARSGLRVVGRIAQRLGNNGGVRVVPVEGQLRLTFDRFGRITGCAPNIARATEDSFSQ